MAEASQTGMSWQQGVESSLHHYRTVFTDKSVLLSLLEEIHTLVEEVKSTINTKMFGFDNKNPSKWQNILYILKQAYHWHRWLKSPSSISVYLMTSPTQQLTILDMLISTNTESFSVILVLYSFKKSKFIQETEYRNKLSAIQYTKLFSYLCLLQKTNIIWLNMIHEQSTFMHRWKVFADI